MNKVESNYKYIFSPSDIEYMSLAIKLAEKGRGKTSPNPMVGAVIVKENRVIGTGFHKKAGEPHAEIEAIRNAKEPLDGSTMYVTLEPCTIYGKTPPCVNQIVKHNFKEIVIGTRDPNPLINGKGIEFLKKRGIKVRVGLLEDKISIQNEVFFKHIRTKMPFVCCKIASTIDGKLATSSGNSKWITSEKSRKMVQKLRNEYKCILTGINTVEKDDPLLFPRKHIGSADTNSLSDLSCNFYRVILDSNLKINLSSRVVKTSNKVNTIIFANSEHRNDPIIKNKVELLKEKNIDVIFVPSSRNTSKNSSAAETYTKLDLSEVLKTIYNQFGITSIMLEAGPTLLTSFLEKKLIDKFYIFMAPLIVGESSYPMFLNLHTDTIENAFKIDFKNVRRIGEDILLIAYPKYNTTNT